jgi:hypothetical protein
MADFEIGLMRAKPGRGGFAEVKMSFQPGMYISDVRLDRVRRYEMAMAALGRDGRVAIRFFIFHQPQLARTT